MSKKILITDYVHPILISGFEQRGYEVIYKKSITPAEVDLQISDLYGIVINSKVKMKGDRLRSAKNLKFIARLGSGLEIIDLELAQKLGIRVINSPEGNRQAVAEHALALLLGLSNKIIPGDRMVKNFNWDREANRGFELRGKKIGLIGFGNTGQAFARLLQAFEMEILAYDKDEAAFAECNLDVRATKMEEILKECEIVSFHLPFTEDTKHFFDSNMIKKCRPGTIVINTSRGSVIDTQALVSGLENGHLGGAGLDVFENEKTASYAHSERLLYQKLFDFDRVICSPHVAGWTHESLEKIARVILKKIDSK